MNLLEDLDFLYNGRFSLFRLEKGNNEWCFEYAVTVALNHGEIGKNPEKITNIKPFINKYKWEGSNFPSEKRLLEKNWEKLTIALDVLCAKKKRKCIPL